MNSNVIKEYLVALGFQLDHPQWNQFQSMLNRAGMEVRRATGGMSHEFSIAAGVIGGALASIVAGTAALLDNTAQADLNYQVFARRMFMTADSAKALKIATDALGYSLEDIIWGPKELQERYRQLIIDQRQLAQGLGGADFERQMKRLRDYRFEFTRFKVEVQYLAMGMARNLSRALFGDDDTLLKRLKSFNDWFTQNIPRIGQQITAHLVPALKDIYAAAKDTLSVGLSLMGLLANDSELRKGEVNINNIGRAFEHVAQVVDNIVKGVRALTWLIRAGLQPVLGGKDAESWKRLLDDSPDWMKQYLRGYEKNRTGESLSDLGKHLHPLRQSHKQIQDEIRRVAHELDIPENIALSLARTESGFDPGATNPKSGAAGVMQLMPKTARRLGVTDSYDAGQNIRGGLTYLKQLFDQYHDWRTALKVYGGFVTKDPTAYQNRVLGGPGPKPIAHHTDVGGITVHVTHPNATAHEIAAAVRDGVSKALGRRDQEHLAQFSGVFA